MRSAANGYRVRMALTPPDDVDFGAVRHALEATRDATRARVDGLAARPEPGSGLGFGKRIGDGTIEAVSRLTEIGVGSVLETTLEQVERALAKLDAGTYGVCDSCGGEIPAARLQARPESTHCVPCAAGARRPPPRRR